jgi:4-amino-4-deoxy-L-arabinose transferase-like glycosyltransferase
MSSIKNIFSSKTLPFWLFTISAILILTISQLIQDGVFMDGMLYISVSKNLADGMGTFWEPHFSKTVMTVFREQPPLYFGMLAIFFKVFGSSMYVERLYCFICFVLTLIYIHKIWKAIFYKEEGIAKNSWLPVLFFASIPVCFWAYANHVEETVMTLFATMSVYYLSKALFKNERLVFNILLAGICVFLSSLTKGIQGMFPMGGVFLYWLVKKDFTFKKNVIYSTLLVATPFLIYGLFILANPHIFEVIKLYLENRLGIAFKGTMHNTTDNRFEIMIRLFTELIPMLGLMLIIFLVHKKSNPNSTVSRVYKTETLWFLLIGFSGSVPLMSTLEQRGFYLLTSLPFFALAGAALIANPISQLVESIKTSNNTFKYTKWAMTIILICSTAYTLSCMGKAKRDKEMLHDVYALGTVIPRGEKLGIPLQMWEKWNFQTYMVRFNYISLDAYTATNKFFAIDKELSKELIPPGYELHPLKTEYLDLYILKNKQ